jgi:glycosyltransferase involved in cell wall biosynthesis
LPNSSISTPNAALPRALFVASPKVQNIGGLERQALAMAVGLKKLGCEVVFACSRDGGLAKMCAEKSVDTLSFYPKNSFDLAASAQLASIMKRGGFEIVHVHSRRDFVPAVFGVLMAGIGRKRPRLILHAHLVRELAAPNKLSEWLFGAAVDRVIAVSEVTRQRIIRDHIIPDERVRLLYNGVDFSRFAEPGSPRAAELRAHYREKWGVPTDSLVIGMLGRLNHKGQDQMLAAFPSLLEREPNLVLVLVGPEGINGYAAKLQSDAKRLGVGDKVVIPGPAYDDAPLLMSAFDVLAHLPTDEAFGLALVEAGAAKVPVVTANAGGCVEVVQDGVNGYVVDPSSPHEIVRVMTKLFDRENGAALRNTMGCAGKDLVHRRFSADNHIVKLKALYAELCPK